MKVNFFYFLLFNFFLNSFAYVMVMNFDSNFFTIDFLFIYNLFLISIATFYTIYISKNLFSLIVLFNLFYILFLYGMVITYVLSNNDNIFYYGLFGGRYLQESSLIQASLIINFVYIIVNISYQIFHRKINLVSESFEKFSNSKIIYSLFYFFSILALTKFTIEYLYISKTSYLQLYLNGLSEVNYYSPIIENSHTFLVALYGFILQRVPSKKNFIICSFVFCISALFSSLKGARILSLLPILFVLWYYYRFYSVINLNSQLKKSLIIFSSLFIFYVFLKSSRNSNEFQLPKISNISEAILNESGMTIQAVASYIEIKEEVTHSYPFVLEPILYPFFYIFNWNDYRAGQSEELVKARNSFNHRFSYAMNKDFYLKGNGLGSSIVSESFQYGVFYLFLVSFIFGYYISFLEKKLKKGSIWLYLSPVIVGGVFIAPRESPFPNTWGFVKMLILLALIHLTIKILNKTTFK